MPKRLVGVRAQTAPPAQWNPYAVEHSDSESLKNIVIFGDSGAGKSSIINMLDSESSQHAAVSNKTSGVTFKSEAYEKYLPGRSRGTKSELSVIHDTAGLNEAESGTVPPRQAIENLWELLGRLEGGLHLLVFVIRAPRLTATTSKNYQLLKSLAGDEVPMALIVTGLENEPDLDEWWTKNKYRFDEIGLRFAGHACITATRGRAIGETTAECVYDDAYAQSITKVEDLLLDTATSNPVTFQRKAWFVNGFVSLCNFFGISLVDERDEVMKLLVSYGIDKKDAKKLTNKMKTRRTLIY